MTTKINIKTVTVRKCTMCKTEFVQKNKRHFKCPHCGAHFTNIISEQEKVTSVKVSMESHTSIRKCRVCGCTDNDCSGCIERTGYRCSWVEEDLCSACVEAKDI